MKYYFIFIFRRIIIVPDSFIAHPQGIAILENNILINWENNKNLKSREFYFFIYSAILSAFDLYFSISIKNTLILTLTKWYSNKKIMIQG